MKKPTTIELTSKKLKLQYALSSLVIFLGLVILLMTGATTFSAFVMMGGLIWLAITKIRIWWNHE